MEHQRLLGMHLGKCKGFAATFTPNQTIGGLSWEKLLL